MALTRDYRETIVERIKRDPEVRRLTFAGAVEQLLEGDVALSKALLRNYVDATIGFERLAQETGMSVVSLKRTLSPRGTPRIAGLMTIVERLQRTTGLHLTVDAKHAEAAE